MARMRMRKKKKIMNMNMELVKDERGQWIISAGFLVSVSIVILALLLNQAMMGGYRSSGAILEFPKHEIRELVQETHREANIAAERAWNMSGEPIVTLDEGNDNANRTAIIANFTTMMSKYNSSVEYLYASHGQMVYIVPQIDYSNFNNVTGKPNKILYVNVTILFSDGVTTCTFDPELIEMPVPGPSFATETLYAVNLTSDDCNITSPENAYNASDGSVAKVSDVGNNDTVNATIDNHTVSVPGNMTGSATFKIKLKTKEEGSKKVDEINISYSPDAGDNWYSVASNVTVPTSLSWIGIYTATNVTTWENVDNMTIRITGKEIAKPDNGVLEIDAYHVYVVYEIPP